MVQKPLLLIFVGIVIGTLGFSGCIDLFMDSSTRYQSYPTSIRYTIRYGYTLSVSGEGTYTIHYECDTPKVLDGGVSSLTLLYPMDYEETTFGENQRIVWNISGTTGATYEAGVQASVVARSFLVADLTGENALTFQEIASLYPTLVTQYCKVQGIEETRYIDPAHSSIQDMARRIKNQSQSNNAFVLAKALFIWLKQYTEYRLHENEAIVQTAAETYLTRAGDCDDLSFLYISLCRSLGIPARFIRGYLLEGDDENPAAGPHAWVEVFVGGGIGNKGWVPVECAGVADIQTEVNQNFGVEDAFHLRLFVDEGSNTSLSLSLSGISWTYSASIAIEASSFDEMTDYLVMESQQLVVTKDDQRSYQ